MQNFSYTQAEAEALVGRVFTSLVEFSGMSAGTLARVPLGTRANVVHSEPSVRGGYDVVIEWKVAQPTQAYRRVGLRVSFWKDVMERYMQEVTA